MGTCACSCLYAALAPSAPPARRPCLPRPSCLLTSSTPSRVGARLQPPSLFCAARLPAPNPCPQVRKLVARLVERLRSSPPSALAQPNDVELLQDTLPKPAPSLGPPELAEGGASPMRLPARGKEEPQVRGSAGLCAWRRAHDAAAASGPGSSGMRAVPCVRRPGGGVAARLWECGSRRALALHAPPPLACSPLRVRWDVPVAFCWMVGVSAPQRVWLDTRAPVGPTPASHTLRHAPCWNAPPVQGDARDSTESRFSTSDLGTCRGQNGKHRHPDLDEAMQQLERELGEWPCLLRGCAC